MTKCLNFTLYSGRHWFRRWQNDVRRLSRICHEFAGPHFSIDIIHIEEEGRRAFHDGVMTIPAILMELPCGRKQMLGGFDETEKYLSQLAHVTRPEAGIDPQREGIAVLSFTL